jgi:hypothetical protein
VSRESRVATVNVSGTVLFDVMSCGRCNLEDGGNMLIRNVDSHYMMSNSRRRE